MMPEDGWIQFSTQRKMGKKEVYKSFKELVRVSPAQPTTAFVRSCNGGFVEAEICASKLDLAQFREQQAATRFLVDVECTRVLSRTLIPDDVPQLLVRSQSPSRMREFRARKGSGEDTCTWLELWSAELGFVKSCKLAPKVSTKIYDDAIFGKVSWSRFEDKVVFIGEVPGPESFRNAFEEEEEEEGNGSDPKEDLIEKYKLEQDFGETLEGKKCPGVFVWSFMENKIRRIPNAVPASHIPLNPIFDASGNGLILQGMYLPFDRKLGLSACLNRKSNLFHLETLYSSPKNLTQGFFLALPPKFSPDFTLLAFFGRRDEFLEHSTCYQLFVMQLGEVPSLVLDLVQNAPGNAGDYVGVFGYHQSLCLGDFCSENTFIFQTYSRGERSVFMVDLNSGAIENLRHESLPPKGEGELELLRVDRPFVLLKHCSSKVPPRCFLGNMETGSFVKLVDKENFEMPLLDLLENVKKKDVRLENGAEAFLLWFENRTTSKLPVIVLIHGGPFSTAGGDTFLLNRNFLLLQGFALLVLNYRGSIGYGARALRSLIGLFGQNDVQDCGELIKAALAENDHLDANRVGIFGASHGGFLTAWLVGDPRFKDLFKCAALWNPVINMSAMISLTDIPEWCLVAIRDGKEGSRWSREDNDLLFKNSPFSVVENVTAPCLVVLGQNDRRVPPSQGMSFFNALKARNVETKLYNFPDSGHAIKPIEQNVHATIAVFIWIDNFLKE